MTDSAEPRADQKPRHRMSLALVWGAVRHHPLAFLGLLVLVAVVGAGVYAFMPTPKHTSSVVFHVAGRAPRVISDTPDNSMDLNSYKVRQAALLKRRLVLNAIRKRPEVAQTPLLQQQSDPVGWLEQNLQVDTRGGEYMRVYLEGDQADDLLAIMKAVTAVFLAEVDQQDNGARKQRLDQLEEAMTRQRGEIQTYQANIDKIAKTLNYADPATMVLYEALIQDELRSARREVLDAEHQIALIRPDAELKVQPDAAKSAIDPAVLDEAVRRQPAVQEAEGRLLLAKQSLGKIEGFYEPGTVNTSITKARVEVKSAEDDLARLKTDLRDRVAADIKNKSSAELVAAQQAVVQRIKELERRKGVAEAYIKEVSARLNSHNLMAADLSKNRKEIAHQQRLLDSMDEQRQNMRVEEGVKSRITLSEEPFVVAGAEGNRRWRNVGIGAGGVFLLGMVGLVAWEFRRKRVSKPDELAAALGVPLLGTLPPSGAAGPTAKRELVEAIDSARTALLHPRVGAAPLRTLVVTSGLPGEGKTSLSAHLAVSLARAGFRTLLVDGDVHRPSIHGLFALTQSPGLCELLRGETGTAAAIRATQVPGLSIIPAGVWTLAARQALVRDRWTTLQAELEGEFDYLVVDTAPVLLMTDTQLLAKAADGVILSALVGVSETAQADLAYRRLTSLGVTVLGLVVAGDPTTLNRRHRYYLTAGEGAHNGGTSPDPIPLSKA